MEIINCKSEDEVWNHYFNELKNYYANRIPFKFTVSDPFKTDTCFSFRVFEFKNTIKFYTFKY